MKTMTLTIDQIKHIFEAGISRGQNEAVAFDWGCRASGKKFDDLVEALIDIVNADKKWGDDGFVEWNEVEQWLKT